MQITETNTGAQMCAVPDCGEDVRMVQVGRLTVHTDTCEFHRLWMSCDACGHWVSDLGQLHYTRSVAGRAGMAVCVACRAEIEHR